MGEPAAMMAATPGYENGRIKEPHWGEKTDYLFYEDNLPKLSEVEHESNARVLAKMLRQKLIHRIKLLTGKEPRLRSGGGHYLDPLKSDPVSPYFYEWRFTPEYPGFPLRPLANWQLYQTKECNAALENGDLYLVDVRNPGARPASKQVVAAPTGVPSSLAVPTGHQNRKRLVNIAEAAFSRYILLETGITSYDYRDVLIGDGSCGLPGWRWIFPSTGTFSKFPEINNFRNWSTDELLNALHALLMKTLRLERFDPPQNQDAEAPGLQQPLSAFTQCLDSEFRMPQAVPTNNYNHPIHIDSPDPAAAEDQLVAELNAAARPDAKIAPDAHDLDDLVTQLTARSLQWKEDWAELQEYQKREHSLRATNTAQASRIEVLEKALRNIETLGLAYNEAHETVPRTESTVDLKGAMNGMEMFYRGEISDLKAQNEELKEVIQAQEGDIQNAVWLREQNKLLETQLAMKTAEASSAYEALAVLTGSGTSLKANAFSAARPLDKHHLQPNQPVQSTGGGSFHKAKCDKCRHQKQACINPGGPCDRCQKNGEGCTFNFQRVHTAKNGEMKISGAVAKARMTTESASQFLQSRQHVSPYSMPPLGQSRPQAQSQQSMHNRQVPQSVYSSTLPPQLTYKNAGGSSGIPPQAMNDNIKRAATNALSSANKRPATENSYQSPYMR
ncbi:hypothetical protein BKA65DRAFT_492021 [Rhexocercosporidium sp. MPI-PUGE-AT-0058]|nr:hypothetical protein BKA65DRAFT_492021 [Rhexocercosporidium sp. MPI-PUGE-AT-0058]